VERFRPSASRKSLVRIGRNVGEKTTALRQFQMYSIPVAAAQKVKLPYLDDWTICVAWDKFTLDAMLAQAIRKYFGKKLRSARQPEFAPHMLSNRELFLYRLSEQAPCHSKRPTLRRAHQHIATVRHVWKSDRHRRIAVIDRYEIRFARRLAVAPFGGFVPIAVTVENPRCVDTPSDAANAHGEKDKRYSYCKACSAEGPTATRA
jgi:hypothetical protein